MVAITTDVLRKASCPQCGGIDTSTYSPLKHVFICQRCGGEYEMPILPFDIEVGKASA